MMYRKVLVLGGSGFVGRHLVAALARRGIHVTVPSRRRERAKHLILLPTVDVVEGDINRKGVLDRLARGHDALINLVGILHGDFAAAHVELPLAGISACRSAGIERILHVSALGASPDAPSEYLRTKAKGEQAMLDAADRHVTILRPSVIFGPEDRFLNQFAARIEARAAEFVDAANAETGLAKTPRLAGAELPRTLTQLRQAAAGGRLAQGWHAICSYVVYPTMIVLVRGS